MCCIPRWRMKDRTSLYILYISLIILFGVKASVVWEGHTDRDRQRQTAILIHNFFSWPYHVVLSLSTSYASRPWILNRRTFRPLPQAGALGDCKLALTHTASNWQAGVCIYYFITSITSDISCDCFYLFKEVNLWLTARSRVKGQYETNE